MYPRGCCAVGGPEALLLFGGQGVMGIAVMLMGLSPSSSDQCLAAAMYILLVPHPPSLFQLSCVSLFCRQIISTAWGPLMKCSLVQPRLHLLPEALTPKARGAELLSQPPPTHEPKLSLLCCLSLASSSSNSLLDTGNPPRGLLLIPHSPLSLQA